MNGPEIGEIEDDLAPENARSGRREFLRTSAIAALGLGVSGSPEQSEAAQDVRASDGEIRPEDIEAVERIAGLDFTTQERETVLPGVRRNLKQFKAARETELANDVLPPLHFHPLQTAGTRALGQGPARFPGESPDRPGADWVGEPTEALPESNEAIAFLTATEQARLIKSGALSPIRLTEIYLARLKRIGPKLRCVITLLENQALEEAREAEEEIRAGKYRGPLHGIPWGAKDLLSARGAPTTWGARPFKDRVIGTDAAVVERLREAGAILIAKLSLGSLAQGDLWYEGRTLNPWNLKRGSSGSSAGPASATAAGLVGFSIGSETLGSIVMPSATCGVTGHRPTFGRVSRHGAMSLTPSMDKLGPMCRSAEDCAVVFAAIHGRDARDGASVTAPFDWNASSTADLSKLRIGYRKQDFDRVANKDDQANAKNALQTLRDLGAELEPIELPKRDIQPLRMILGVEAAAMFDAFTRENVDDELTAQNPFSWPNTFRTARMVPAVEFLRAQRIRTLLMREMEEAMNGFDLYVAPPTTGPTMLITNLTGHPTVVVPHGFVKGTPRAITFVGGLDRDDVTLGVAARYQAATDWHKKHPTV